MKNKISISGLSCPNCAKLLENELNKLESIQNASIDFLKSTLAFECKNLQLAKQDIISTAKRIEPKVSFIFEEQLTKSKVMISGLACPNCAKTLETKLAKLTSCKNVEIDFLKSSLTFESENPEFAFLDIVAEAKKVDPDIQITKAKQKRGFDKKFFVDLSCLIAGIGIGLCALFISLPLWAFWTMFVASAMLMGYKTYYKAFRLLLKGVINENLLITISVIGATTLGEHMEGLMVIALYSIGKVLEGLAVSKSRKSIEELTNLQPEFAIVLDGEEEKRISPKEIKIGDTLLIRAGEKVSVDGIVIEGEATLDLQSLTGESLPANTEIGQEIMSGTIVHDGVIKVEATRTYDNSTVSKIMELIEHASEKKSKTETFISKITKWYTLGVIILSVLVWGIVWLVTNDINTAIYRGLIFLVVSCPCAFAISVPLSYFSGIGNASKKGILIKGSNYLDACAKLNTIAFDKTGTLTTGHFEIEEIKSFDNKYTQEDILYIASLGEQYSTHPLAKSIVKANAKKLKQIKNVKEIAGHGVSFKHNNHEYFVGRKTSNLSHTSVEVFEDDNKVGQILLADTIKQTSKTACKNLSQLGVKTVLLSGDNKTIVEKVATEVGVAEYHSQLLPQDKYRWIENAKADKNLSLGYVGDGINDAPSLMRADIGISMGINGSSASIEASDIVLMDDNPEKVVTAIKISKYTQKIVWQNIIFSASIKVLFLTLGSFGITGMLSAVIADVGVTLLAILNSLRALHYTPKNKEKQNKHN